MLACCSLPLRTTAYQRLLLRANMAKNKTNHGKTATDKAQANAHPQAQEVPVSQLYHDLDKAVQDGRYDRALKVCNKCTLYRALGTATGSLPCPALYLVLTDVSFNFVGLFAVLDGGVCL
jgi:hypothetical protein